MKKITRTLFAALAVASMAACTQEIEGPVNPSALALDEFGASTETSTKVTIADWKLSWEAGDQVDIYDGTEKAVFAAADAGESTVLKAEDQDFAREDDKTYYAVYPSSDANEFDGSSVTLTVAGDRTAVAGQYPSAPAVGVTEGSEANFTFRNVCGLVSFAIAADQNITSVVIFGGNNENMAGTVKVNAETAGYELVEGTGVKEILLTPAEGETFAEGRYYVAVLPQEFTKGLSVTLYRNDGTRLRKNLNAFTLGRSTHVDVETVGTFKTEFTIKNADELVSFLEVADKCVAGTVATLANDIDLSGVTLPAVSEFAGTFDGASHSLKNWTTDGPLFTKIAAGATVKNLILDASCTLNMKETSGNTQSYVVGLNEGTVSGCTNNADVTYALAAGTPLVKRTFGTIVSSSTGVVSDCHNTGDITITIPKLTSGEAGQHQRIGGVVGSFLSVAGTEAVKECTNTGDITVTYQGSDAKEYAPHINIGGVCAQGCNEDPASDGKVNHGTIKTCTNSGKISLATSGVVADKSYNYYNIGGIVGYLEGTLDDCDNLSDGEVVLTNEKTLKISSPSVGGVAGSVLSGSVLNCSNAAPVSFVGAIWNGITKAVYVGGIHTFTIGGIAGKVGNIAESTSYSIGDCTNSGAVTAEIYGEGDSYARVGGIVGWTSVPVNGSAANKLQNSGAVTVKKGTLMKGYIGGVIGQSISTFDKVYNTSSGTVSVTLDEEYGNEIWVAGIAGEMDKAANEATFKQGNNRGNISLTGNGKSNSSKIVYIGGVVGQACAKKINSNGSTWELSNTNYGNITVSSARILNVGGVVGGDKGDNGAQYGSFQYAKNNGSITVTDAKEGSCIGGIVGYHEKGRIGNSVNFGDQSTYPIIEVSTTASGVYVGGCVGKVHTSNTAAVVGYSSNLSGIKVYGKITASDGVAAGIIAGCVNVHGDTAEPKMNLGTSYDERPSIHTTTEINGAKVGSLTENVSDFAKSISTYFGLLSKGGVETDYTFYYSGSTDNQATNIVDCLQNWK